jgi:hypothetical protein
VTSKLGVYLTNAFPAVNNREGRPWPVVAAWAMAIRGCNAPLALRVRLRLITIASGIRGRTPRAPWLRSCRLWVARFLLVSSDEAPPLLQVADTALDGIPVAVPLLVARWRAPGAFSDAFASRDGRLDASVRQPAPDPGGIVAAIPRAASGRLRGRPRGRGTDASFIRSTKKADSWRCPADRTAPSGRP